MHKRTALRRPIRWWWWFYCQCKCSSTSIVLVGDRTERESKPSRGVRCYIVASTWCERIFSALAALGVFPCGFTIRRSTITSSSSDCSLHVELANSLADKEVTGGQSQSRLFSLSLCFVPPVFYFLRSVSCLLVSLKPFPFQHTTHTQTKGN